MLMLQSRWITQKTDASAQSHPKFVHYIRFHLYPTGFTHLLGFLYRKHSTRSLFLELEEHVYKRKGWRKPIHWAHVHLVITTTTVVRAFPVPETDLYTSCQNWRSAQLATALLTRNDPPGSKCYEKIIFKDISLHCFWQNVLVFHCLKAFVIKLFLPISNSNNH